MSGASLDAIAGSDGRFAVLAMDQRATLRRMLDRGRAAVRRTPISPPSRSTSSVHSRRSRAACCSTPDYGVGPVRAAGALPDGVGPARRGRARRQGSVERRAARPGRSGAGRRVRPAPTAATRSSSSCSGDPAGRIAPAIPTSPAEALTVVGDVVADCRRAGVPSVIEPLIAKLPDESPLSAAGHRGARDRVGCADGGRASRPPEARVARQRRGLPPRHRSTRRRCPGHCSPPASGSTTSSSAFASALDNGASGFIAGAPSGARRSNSPAPRASDFLEQTAVPRLATLSDLLAEHGRSWREVAA